MPYFFPPALPNSYQLAYENSAENLRQSSPSKKSEQEQPSSIGNSPKVAPIPSEVETGLRSLMEAIPILSKNNLISQAGAVKPENIPSRKPTDPPLPVLQPIKGLPINVIADKQEYDAKAQTFVARGNVSVIYQQSQLKADVVRLNLVTKQATAEGNVFLQRREQILRGSTLEYNYGTTKGVLEQASGQINLGNVARSPTDQSASDASSRSTIFNVFGSDFPSSLPNRTIGRIGFQAERLVLDGDTWYADNLKITNDPYAPPELELRTRRATLTAINPQQDRLDAESPTLVFDQGLSLPIPVSSLILDRFERSFPARLGFDRRDQGGFFYQQNFDVYSKPDINFQISPQLFLQRGIENRGNLLDFNLLGVAAKLDATLPDSQYLSGKATLSSLNLADAENQLRASLSYSRPVLGDHTFVARYTYRDRLFNGSLGYQDVRNSLGVSLFSPYYVLGDSEINFSYQAAVQYIGADREQSPSQPLDVASLVRLQGATALSRNFPLWRGTTLPAEKELGLKYFPEPITPALDAVLGINANYSFYSSGDSQSFLSGTVGLLAVIGNFSKPLFDYTKINVSYTQGFVGGKSPFLFDRVVDAQSFTVGILQQIYGPFRFGAEQTWNPATGRIIDSNYSLQYDRRTYAVVIRYNPTREIGELVLRVSDFNWGDPSSNVVPVKGGVERR